MRCLHVRISGDSEQMHPLLSYVTDPDLFRNVLMLDWSFSADPPSTAVLLYLDGELDTYDAVLDSAEVVIHHELTKVDDSRGYVFVHSHSPQIERDLLAVASQDGLLPISPVEYHRDGSFSFRVLGTLKTLQAAIAATPNAVETSIERLGGHEFGRPPLPTALPPRQREVLQTAYDIGYYDVPRAATRDDVAKQVGIAPSTASEHLQKAERRLVRWFFRDQ